LAPGGRRPVVGADRHARSKTLGSAHVHFRNTTVPSRRRIVVDLKELTNRLKELVSGKRSGGGGTQPSNQDPGGDQAAGGSAAGGSYSSESGSAGTGGQGDVAATQPDTQDEGVSADGQQDAADSDVGDPGAGQTP
jgi:hypothetical protein